MPDTTERAVRGPRSTVVYTYDAAGRLVQADYGEKRINYVYSTFR